METTERVMPSREAEVLMGYDERMGNPGRLQRLAHAAGLTRVTGVIADKQLPLLIRLRSEGREQPGQFGAALICQKLDSNGHGKGVRKAKEVLRVAQDDE